ncbi:hypothetical protein [Prosthecobacter sp.]|uniref:hypothetical protein n=1 Tax=Prosthecobacter sp. TaxID=1965333 RepID=UPI003784D470
MKLLVRHRADQRFIRRSLLRLQEAGAVRFDQPAHDGAAFGEISFGFGVHSRLDCDFETIARLISASPFESYEAAIDPVTKKTAARGIIPASFYNRFKCAFDSMRIIDFATPVAAL